MNRVTIIWYLACLACWFISGASDGLAETLQFHYSSFTARHPNIDQLFWNPQISWMNKYLPGTLTPKFLGSTTLFVFLTDAYHLCRTLTSWLAITGWLIACMSFRLLFAEIKIWSIPVTAIAFWAAKAAGFHLLYTYFYG